MSSLLLALGVLLGLKLASRWSQPFAWAAVPALLTAAVAGLTFPDVDHPLPFDHRSGFTHSALPAVAIAWARWARPAAAGLAIGIGLHLSADIFPEAMVGFATVKLPFFGSIGTEGSYFWLVSNALGCALLGGVLLRSEVRHEGMKLAALAALAVIGFVYLIGVDGGWPALILIAFAAWLALRRRTIAA